jgi:hypothetical protein
MPHDAVTSVKGSNAHTRIWTRRRIGLKRDKFQNEILEPLMSHVAARHMKRNFGLIIAAICGRSTMFPVQTNYKHYCKTPTFQIFSAELTRMCLQPSYEGIITKTQTVMPTSIKLEDRIIPVYPTWNERYGIPRHIIAKLEECLKSNGVDSASFTHDGGEIQLTEPFLRAIAYFATDPIIWGDTIRPMTHVPMNLRLKEDLPDYITKKQSGRSRGRPRKSL